MRYRTRFARVILLKLFWLAVVPVLAADPLEIVGEDRARAGFLFQIAQYVQWPAGAFPIDASPLRFCILAQDSLFTNLEVTAKGKSIQGHPVVVKSVRNQSRLEGCHVVFIGLARDRQLRDLLAHWSYPHVLLIGEASQFAEMGGMVNLTLEGGRVSFEINPAAADRAGLVFRSQLLRFAKVVVERRGAL